MQTPYLFRKPYPFRERKRQYFYKNFIYFQDVIQGDGIPIFLTQLRTKLPIPLYPKSEDFLSPEHIQPTSKIGDSSRVPLFGVTFSLVKIPESQAKEESFIKNNIVLLNTTDPSLYSRDDDETEAFYGKKQVIISRRFTTKNLPARKKEFFDLREGDKPESLIAEIYLILTLQYEKKYGVDFEEEAGDIPYLFKLNEYKSHVGFITSFYKKSDNDYLPVPTRFSNFVLEWLAINAISAVIESPSANMNLYARSRFIIYSKVLEAFEKPNELSEDAVFVTFVDPGKYLEFTMTGIRNEPKFTIPPRDSLLFFGVSEEWKPSEKADSVEYFSDVSDYIMWFYSVLRENMTKRQEEAKYRKTLLPFVDKEKMVRNFIDKVLPNLSFYVAKENHEKGYKLLLSENFGVESEEFSSYERNPTFVELDKNITFIIRRLMGIDYRTDGLKRSGRTGELMQPYHTVNLLDKLSPMFSPIGQAHFNSGTTLSGMFDKLVEIYASEEERSRKEEKEKEKPVSPAFPVEEEQETFDTFPDIIKEYKSDDSKRRFLILPDDILSVYNLNKATTLPFGLNTIISGLIKYGNSKGEKERKPGSPIKGDSSLGKASSSEEREILTHVNIYNAEGQEKFEIERLNSDRAPKHIYPYFDPQRSTKPAGEDISNLVKAFSFMPKSGHFKSEIFNMGINNLMPCGHISDRKETTALVTSIVNPPSSEDAEDLESKRYKSSSILRKRVTNRRRIAAIETNKMKKMLIRRIKYSRWFLWYKENINPKATMTELYEFVYNSDETLREKSFSLERVMKMGLLAPENAMSVFSRDEKVPKTYLELDSICSFASTLMFGRFPSYHLDDHLPLDKLTYTTKKDDISSFSRNVNVTQGPPSFSVKSFAQPWLSAWKEAGALDSNDNTMFLQDPFKYASAKGEPPGDKKEMSDHDISLYFTSILGIEETEQYAFINLAEMENRSYYNKIRGIEDNQKILEKVWSEISRFGNLSKLPRTKRNKYAWDSPKYLDEIPKGGWNGLRCIFIVGRTTSRKGFIKDILSTETKPFANLHWVLMTLVTGDVEGDKRQMLFYDSMMRPNSGPIHENYMIAQMVLYGIISPKGYTIGSQGYRASDGIEYSDINNVKKSSFNELGSMAFLTLEEKSSIRTLIRKKSFVDSMIQNAENEGVTEWYSNKNMKDAIESELGSRKVDSKGFYQLENEKSTTKLITYFSQLMAVPAIQFTDKFKKDLEQIANPLYVVRPGPFLRNVILQKSNWECGYFCCAMARHVITLGEKHSIPPNNGAIELSWCAESIGPGGANCYVITQDKNEKYTGIFPLWPREDIINEEVTGKNETFNRFSYYLHNLLHPAICGLRTNSLPWSENVPYAVKVDVYGDYLKQMGTNKAEKINVVGDIIRYGDKERFGNTLYRITRMHSFAIPNDCLNQVEIYSVPRNFEGEDISLEPEFEYDVPWRPQIVKHCYPVEITPDILALNPKLSIYSNIGLSLNPYVDSEITGKRLQEFTTKPWLYTGGKICDKKENEEEQI